MLTRAKPWILLACCAIAAAALVASWAEMPGRSDLFPPMVPTPSVDDLTPVASTGIERPSAPLEGKSVAANASQPGTKEADQPFSTGLEDPAALQQLVQFALLGDQRKGTASRAAIAIARCITLEPRTEQLRAFMEGNEVKLNNETKVLFLNMQARALRMCQALDASSRAQWLPLVRRGLEESQVGNAEEMLSAFEGSPYEEQVRAEVLHSLRTDAFACHESSMFKLYFWPTQRGSVLTKSELAAFSQVLKTLLAAKPGEPWQSLVRQLTETVQEGDPAEVQRLVDAIRSHC